MGALTLKAFSDELREWEFIEGEGIDPTDSFGTDLRLSIRENQVFLAEPNDPDMPWLTDKGRLFFDGMFDETSESQTDWKSFFNEILELMYFVDHLNFHRKLSSSFIFAFENLSLETLNMLYLIEQSCSIVKLRRVESYNSFNDLESNYQLSPMTQKSKLHMSSLCILLNTNPRYEGYVLNLSLRQRFLKGDFKLLNIGSNLDLTVPVYTIGSNLNALRNLSEGTHLSCQDIKNANYPLLVTNTEMFKRADAKIFTEVLKYTSAMDIAWSVLNHNISSTGIQTMNKFLPLSVEDLASFFGIYYINVSLNSTANMKKLVEIHLLQIFMNFSQYSNPMFVDQSAKAINRLVYERTKDKVFKDYFHLPTNLFLEDNESFINTQGLVKRTTKLIDFKKDAKTHWQITRKFYANTKSLVFLNNRKDNNLINFDSVNAFSFRNYVNFQFYAVQTLVSLSFYLTKQNFPLMRLQDSRLKTARIKLLDTKLKSWLDDFFNNSGKDAFSYNSSVLVNCSRITRTSSTNFF